MTDVAAVNCTDPSAIFHQSCWDTLDVADYLGTGWLWTFPQCDNSTMAGVSGMGIALQKIGFKRALTVGLQVAALRMNLGQHAFCDMDGTVLERIVPPSTTKTAPGHRMRVQAVGQNGKVV